MLDNFLFIYKILQDFALWHYNKTQAKFGVFFEEKQSEAAIFG
jgi:hypothetical protein